LDKSTRPMLYRKLIYTAITRAKKKVIFIWKKKALIEAIKNNKEERRRSLVSYLLNQNFWNAKEEKDFLNQLKSSF
jgi:ATP-dependent exoDNAse (exonuclease V) alpha subunit